MISTKLILVLLIFSYGAIFFAGYLVGTKDSMDMFHLGAEYGYKVGTHQKETGGGR